MNSDRALEAKVRRGAYSAIAKSSLWLPSALIGTVAVLAVLLIVTAPGRVAQATTVLLVTIVVGSIFFAILIRRAGRRADDAAGFVATLRPRLRDAAVTREEGLVLVLDNQMLIHVENIRSSPMGDPFIGCRMFADRSSVIHSPSIEKFVDWHWRYHGVRILRPLDAFYRDGDEMRGFDSIRTRLRSTYALVTLFERDLGRRNAPEGVIREAAADILLPAGGRWGN